jgi:transcriptional regulator with XRE-family HTH domain
VRSEKLRQIKTHLEHDADARLGRVIAEMRIHANLTQSQLAERAKTTQSHISEIETGATGIGLYVLRRVVGALGYDCKIIVERRYEA